MVAFNQSIARRFLILPILAGMLWGACFPSVSNDILDEFGDPSREFSVMPFWFWNDDLKNEEIIRQIADFEAHGVYGFVIHPRIGLPEDLTLLSPRMMKHMRVAIEEAARRNMRVVLYDEGMYPSGSAGGQVVARNPNHAARGLAKIDLEPGEELELKDGWKLVAILDRPNGQRLAVVDRPSGGVIRGLRYLDETGRRPKEESFPAGDILNPEATASFIELVYERFYKEFGTHFGETIIGIFTDEPDPLGRGHARGMMRGNLAAMEQIKGILSYDFKPYLADLWYEDHPDSLRRRAEYHRAVNVCLEENYYRQLSEWCAKHGVALTGHPAGSMDIGTERYFQIPGQDLVWRYVEPGPKALEGQHSTMAKCASSAMLHLGRRRNSNEIYGAYGHNLTYDEMEWLAGWCFVRGQNLLYPHAFYYSIRGPRIDERPPDVGPNAAWWDRYQAYADYCRRMCWLNTDSRQVCDLAILGDSIWLPDEPAKVCFENQLDFNYLEYRHLWEDAKIGIDGVELAGMKYGAVVLDGSTHLPDQAKPYLRKLGEAGRLVIWNSSDETSSIRGAAMAADAQALVAAVQKHVARDVSLNPALDSIRIRHVVKGGLDFYIFFNEGSEPVVARIDVTAQGKRQWLDPFTGRMTRGATGGSIEFRSHEMKVLMVGDR